VRAAHVLTALALGPLALWPGLAAAAELPEFRATVRVLSAEERRGMIPDAWRRGCPVELGRLRAIELRHVGFGGRARTGTLVVHHSVAADAVAIFRRLYAARFPIRRVVPVERYGGRDRRSMAADNTHGFNCRYVAGTRRWSEHALGRAIDVNPVENPYVGARISPPAGRRFLDRSRPRRGMISAGDPAERAFRAEGWGWGGRWRGARDYHHFSASGR